MIQLNKPCPCNCGALSQDHCWETSDFDIEPCIYCSDPTHISHIYNNKPIPICDNCHNNRNNDRLESMIAFVRNNP